MYTRCLTQLEAVFGGGYAVHVRYTENSVKMWTLRNIYSHDYVAVKDLYIMYMTIGETFINVRNMYLSGQGYGHAFKS